MSGHGYILTTHALQRYEQRGGLVGLEIEMHYAEPYSVKIEGCVLLKLPCGLVAVRKRWKHQPDRFAIVTVLTEKQARNNARDEYFDRPDRRIPQKQRRQRRDTRALLEMQD